MALERKKSSRWMGAGGILIALLVCFGGCASTAEREAFRDFHKVRNAEGRSGTAPTERRLPELGSESVLSDYLTYVW